MSETVRIDKWLWAARFFKTRSLAADAIESGKVRWNDERTKPSRNLKIGDNLLIDNGAMQWQVTVSILSDKRGAAALAQTLYLETPESISRRQHEAEQRKLFHEPTSRLKGRPTKRDRRLLDQSRS
ncbi:MAG TPA: RNA-binding S4 domain-containing protein [Herbaspirillum sp.]|nr:RNA-binding S4 domain-containing protein [Herbaspirillum sp.]